MKILLRVAAVAGSLLTPAVARADWSGRVKVPAGGFVTLEIPVRVRDGSTARLDLTIDGRAPNATGRGCVLFLSWPGVAAVAADCRPGANRTRVRFASARRRPVVVAVSYGVHPDDVVDVEPAAETLERFR